MKKSVSVFLVLCCVLSSIICHAERLPYKIVTYSPAAERKTSDKSDFEGIWKSKYVELQGYMLDAESCGVQVDIEIVEGWPAIVNSNGTFYVGKHYMQNGRFITSLNLNEYVLILLDDGMMSMDVKEGTFVDGKYTIAEYTIYCEKKKISYEYIPYSFLERNPNEYIGRYAMFTGYLTEVYDSMLYRLAVNGDKEQTIVILGHNDSNITLKTGDHVNAYVRLDGEVIYSDPSTFNREKDLKAYMHAFERIH